MYGISKLDSGEVTPFQVPNIITTNSTLRDHIESTSYEATQSVKPDEPVYDPNYNPENTRKVLLNHNSDIMGPPEVLNETPRYSESDQLSENSVSQGSNLPKSSSKSQVVDRQSENGQLRKNSLNNDQAKSGNKKRKNKKRNKNKNKNKDNQANSINQNNQSQNHNQNQNQNQNKGQNSAKKRDQKQNNKNQTPKLKNENKPKNDSKPKSQKVEGMLSY